MSNAVLKNEIENLPQAAVDEVIDFDDPISYFAEYM